MPVAPLLQRFVDDELARATTLIEQVRLEAIRQLQSPKADPAQAIEAAKHELRLGHDIARLLGRQPARWTDAFVAALREAALARLTRKPPPAGPDALLLPPPIDDGFAASGGFALMDETQIEADIELSRVLMLLDDAVEWEQRELQTFTSALYGETHVGADTNPLGTQVYAQALWQAAVALQQLAPVGQRLLLRVSAAALAPHLRLAYAAACSRLESQGVEPSLYRTQILRPGGVAERPARVPADTGPLFEATRPGTLEGLRDSLPPAGALAARSGLPEGAGRGAGPTAVPHRDDAAGRSGRDPAGRAAGTPGESERQVAELMSRLFEAMLSDPRLPAAARAAIARLQASVLSVALSDSTLLQAHDHPAWQLIGRIAAAMQDTTAPSSQAEAVAYCEALVEEMVRQPEADEALCRRMLARFESWAAEQLKAGQQAVRPVIESLEHLEHRRRLQTFVQARLEEQIGAALLPAAIQRFLLGPWATLIADAMLTGGERGDATTRHAQTVDQLLRSLEPPVDAVERQALVRLLPGLLQALRDGMVQLRLPAAEQQAFLDELLAAHADTLRIGAGVVEPVRAETAEAPAEIMRRLRAEPAGMPGSGSRAADSVIDEPALDTVPAELLPAQDAADAERAGPSRAAEDLANRWADAVQPGDSVRLWLAGSWLDARLLWRSGSGELLLFTGIRGATHALTRSALARLHAEGLAGGPMHVAVIQRAVDRIGQQAAAAPGR